MKRTQKTNLHKLEKQALVDEMLANVTGGGLLGPVYGKCEKCAKCSKFGDPIGSLPDLPGLPGLPGFPRF